MKPIGIALVISFLAIAGFGLTAIDHGAPLHTGLTGCLASLLTGSACSENFSPYAAASFHLDAFKNFVTAIPSFALWLVALFTLTFFLIARYVPTAVGTRHPLLPHFFHYHTKSRTDAPLVLEQRLLWLSRLEARDPSRI